MEAISLQVSAPVETSGSRLDALPWYVWRRVPAPRRGVVFDPPLDVDRPTRMDLERTWSQRRHRSRIL